MAAPAFYLISGRPKKKKKKKKKNKKKKKKVASQLSGNCRGESRVSRKQTNSEEGCLARWSASSKPKKKEYKQPAKTKKQKSPWPTRTNKKK